MTQPDHFQVILAATVKIAASLAAGLSEQALLAPPRAQECATQMKHIAGLIEDRLFDLHPNPLAVVLHTLAAEIEFRLANRPPTT